MWSFDCFARDFSLLFMLSKILCKLKLLSPARNCSGALSSVLGIVLLSVLHQLKRGNLSAYNSSLHVLQLFTTASNCF